jgi:hypothetical protein
LDIGASASVSANSRGCTFAGTGYAGPLYVGRGPHLSTGVCTDNNYPAVNGGGLSAANRGQSGGSYGNVGGAGQSDTTTLTYVSLTSGSNSAPIFLGASGVTKGGDAASRALAGKGGGKIRISAATVEHDGVISANGSDGTANAEKSGSGGSGGSIYLTASSNLNGTGTFAANGGAGAADPYDYDSGGGSGGRIAIEAAGGTFSFSDSADFTVTGGDGGPSGATDIANDGANGTVFLKNTTNNDITIHHGYTIYDHDLSARDITISTSAISSESYKNNIYCSETIDSGATPSMSASRNLSWGGKLKCAKTIASFALSAGNDLDLAGVDSSSRALIQLAAGSLDFTVPAANPSTWSNTDITLAQGTGGPYGALFTINDAADITVSGTSTISANIDWQGLSSLDLADATAVISADAFGCSGGYYGWSGAYAAYGPNVSTGVCQVNTHPTSPGPIHGGGYSGSGAAGTGGGHGGLGGVGSNYSYLGITYGSATAPILVGSSGGGRADAAQGNGGGKVRISAGSLNLDGVISANGGDGSYHASYPGGGGGSGGSVYVTVSGPISGTGGSFQAAGGDGNNDASLDGGGGGGGRVYYTYAGGSNAGISCVVTGGLGPDTAADGAVGTCGSLLTDEAPNVSSVSHTPTSPRVIDQVQISATATDDNGIDEMKIYVDSGSGYVLKKTCTFSASSPATCSTSGELFARGSHTVKVEATDTAANTDTDTSHTFSVAAETTSNLVILGREKINTPTIFEVSFDLAGTSTGTLTVTFPTGFVLGNFATTVPSGSCVGGTVSSFNRVSDTVFTAAKSGCGAGTVSVANVPMTTPGTPGEYIVTWTNDNGEGVLYVIDDDTVMINAEIDPSLTFDLDIATSNIDSTQPYNLSLGTLLTTQINGSDDSAYPGIWVDISTNATGGALITVLSANAALMSASVNGDTIPSGAVSVGNEGYGLCVASGGNGTPTATAGTLTKVSPFDGTCTTSSFTVGTLTTGAQTIFNTSGNPIDGGRAQIRAAASISSLTEAHNDYTDTLTLIATGTF